MWVERISQEIQDREKKKYFGNGKTSDGRGISQLQEDNKELIDAIYADNNDELVTINIKAFEAFMKGVFEIRGYPIDKVMQALKEELYETNEAQLLRNASIDVEKAMRGEESVQKTYVNYFSIYSQALAGKFLISSSERNISR